MTWLDRLERRFGFIAVPGLLQYVAMLMFVIFFLNMSGLLSYQHTMMHSPSVMQGQVWRLITFLFIPLSSSPLFLFFELMILVMIGNALEAEWGEFRLTVYYLCGAFATIIAAFILPGSGYGSSFLNLSLFLAFATLFPDYEFLLFFILPVKVKYLAWLSAAMIFYQILLAGALSTKILALLSVGNYLLFFGPSLLQTMSRNRKNLRRRQVFAAAARPAEQARHCCRTCSRTEISNPELQFRYCTCADCGANGVAFCMEHLTAHLTTTEATAEVASKADTKPQ